MCMKHASIAHLWQNIEPHETLIMQNIVVITMSRLRLTLSRSLPSHAIDIVWHTLTLMTCMVNYAWTWTSNHYLSFFVFFKKIKENMYRSSIDILFANGHFTFAKTIHVLRIHQSLNAFSNNGSLSDPSIGSKRKLQFPCTRMFFNYPHEREVVRVLWLDTRDWKYNSMCSFVAFNHPPTCLTRSPFVTTFSMHMCHPNPLPMCTWPSL